jgi:Rieske 2Fe-2S family protein
MYTHRFSRLCAYAGVQQDMKKVWQTSWLFAGFTFQIPNTGDYFTYQVGNDSIIVIRGTSHSALLRVARAIG